MLRTWLFNDELPSAVSLQENVGGGVVYIRCLAINRLNDVDMRRHDPDVSFDSDSYVEQFPALFLNLYHVAVQRLALIPVARVLDPRNVVREDVAQANRISLNGRIAPLVLKSYDLDFIGGLRRVILHALGGKFQLGKE
jgi:hypothetical protein